MKILKSYKERKKVELISQHGEQAAYRIVSKIQVKYVLSFQ